MAMVKLIEDQIHEFLIQQEEQRCKALEESYAKEGSKKKVERKKIKKPWKRSYQEALCQESELLTMVSECDYDLDNKKFQRYCESRGVLNVAGDTGSKRWTYFEDFKLKKTNYLKDAYFHYAEEHEKKKHKFTKEEMDTQWEIINLGRAILQDCWEIYKHTK